MVKITKVVERNEFDSVVEVQVTFRTVIREGRDMPDMTFNGVQVKDDDLIVAVHEAMDGDEILEAEMSRILD